MKVNTLHWVKKLDPFSFEHNFRKLCPILIILSLLQTKIICPQTHNWIFHFTYSLLLHYLEKCNRIHFFTKTVEKYAMHVVISSLLQSRKFWWYLLLTSSMLFRDVMTSYCCQRYAECLVMTLCSSMAVHRHTAPRTCNSWTAASRNAKLSCVQAVVSKQPRSQSCELRDLGCHGASCRQINSADELKRRLIDVRCGLEQSIFDEAIDQWRGIHRLCVRAKGGHFEYSLWTDNVDFCPCLLQSLWPVWVLHL